MIEFLRDYLEDLYDFLPKRVVSSPISKQVKAKVMEVMGQSFKSYNPLYFACYKVRHTLHVSASDSFDLALLPEVLEQNYCNYTYYKWVKTDLGYDLILYNYKPKEYLWYLVKMILFQVGYLLALLVGFTPICLVLYYLSSNYQFGSLTWVVQALICFLLAMNFYLGCLVSLVCADFYIRKLRQTKFGHYLVQVYQFDKIENIEEPMVL